MAVGLDTAALVATTSLAVAKSLARRTSWMRASLEPFRATGASGGAWTWEDGEATLVPEVCRPLKGLQKGRLTPGCYVGRTEVHAKGQH
jgi:hypothetical protein